MLVPLEEELDRELGKLARPRPSRKDKTIVLDEHDVDLDDAVPVEVVIDDEPAPTSEVRIARSELGPIERTALMPVAAAMVTLRSAEARSSVLPRPAPAAASDALARMAPTVQLTPSPRDKGGGVVRVVRAFTLGGLVALLVVVATQAFPREVSSAMRAVGRAAHHAVDAAHGRTR
jgi:hypothetical protein